MAYIIAEPCIGTKDKACVEVCPVECIHEAKDLLFIDPDECIDCGACVDPCPVDAIFSEDDLPEKWKAYTEVNSELNKQRNEGKETEERLVELPPKTG